MAPVSSSRLHAVAKTFKIFGWPFVGAIAAGCIAIWLLDRGIGSPAASEQAPARATPAPARQEATPPPEEILPPTPVNILETADAGIYPWNADAVPSLDSIRRKASRAAWRKAHLKTDLRMQMIGEDSIDKVHIPLEDTVFGMILAYRKAIATGSSCGGWPDLPIEETARHPDAARLLPRIARSDFLARRRVFFLGGGYFMQPQDTEDGSPYLSPSGEPEIRRIDDQTDNAHRAVDALRCYPGARIDVRPGLPQPSYDTGLLDVYGIGALEHVLLDRIPAFYLTRNGLVPAEVVSVSVQLAYPDMCVIAHSPLVRFAGPALHDTEVLGVIVSPDSIPRSATKVQWSRELWTADIDGDGTADFAGITRELEALGPSVTLIEIFWYANIDGTWRLIDHAVEHDCT